MKNTILIILSFLTSVLNIYSQKTTDTEQISNLYQQFETSIKENNSFKHLDLYISPEVQLFVVKMNSKAIKYSNFWNAEKWNQFAMNPNYYLKITEQSYKNLNNVSICTGDWEQFKDGKSNGKGKDQFLAINTIKGLKLILLTNSIRTQEILYDNVKLTNSPDSLVNDLLESINNRRSDSLYIKSLVNEKALFMDLNEIYSQEFNPKNHIAKNYLLELNARLGEQAKLKIKDVKITIVDHFITHITTQYTYKKNNKIVESGNLIISGLASSDKNWQINGVIFEHN